MIPNDNLVNAAYSLAAAGSWGAADFTGGLASRRASSIGVLLASQCTGFVGLVAMALITRESLPSFTIAFWAALAGAANVVGFIAFYRALVVGKMGVNAPITAVLTAGLPVIVGAFIEGAPRGIQIAGFLIALAGIWLLARPDASGIRTEGLGLAIFAGVFFSAFLVLMRVAGQYATGWPLSIARLAGVSILLTLVVARPGERLPERSILPLALVAGVLDAAGTVFFLPAVRHGRLDVAAVLASLYPVTTVVLARIVLRERLTRVQMAGMVAALVAVPMIAG